MVFFKANTGPNAPNDTIEAFSLLGLAHNHSNANSDPPTNNKLSDELLKVKQGQYGNYAAKTLMCFAGWSYSDFDTFKDMVADTAGPQVDTIMLQVKNQPMVIQATAQMIRTNDKKVAIIIFRGTEMTNIINWMTDAIAKQSDFYDLKRTTTTTTTSDNDDPTTTVQEKEEEENHHHVKVHTGFKTNFHSVWFGQKGIRMHLLHPEMMRQDYDYDKPRDQQFDGKTGKPIPDEQEDLEAIYICGHSLGGAMAFLAGLYLGAFMNNNETTTTNLFSKLRGVYTYGSPMVIDDYDRDQCQAICGHVTFRHVYYNDIVPHLPPLSTGAFDHVGPEYRYHPRHGWKKRKGNNELVGLWHAGRSTQVGSLLITAPFGAADWALDQINWLNFFRGEDRDLPVIGFLSRGYLKMPWSFMDHSPVFYTNSLAKLKDEESLDDDTDNDNYDS